MKLSLIICLVMTMVIPIILCSLFSLTVCAKTVDVDLVAVPMDITVAQFFDNDYTSSHYKSQLIGYFHPVTRLSTGSYYIDTSTDSFYLITNTVSNSSVVARGSTLNNSVYSLAASSVVQYASVSGITEAQMRAIINSQTSSIINNNNTNIQRIVDAISNQSASIIAHINSLKLSLDSINSSIDDINQFLKQNRYRAPYPVSTSRSYKPFYNSQLQGNNVYVSYDTYYHDTALSIYFPSSQTNVTFSPGSYALSIWTNRTEEKDVFSLFSQRSYIHAASFHSSLLPITIDAIRFTSNGIFLEFTVVRQISATTLADNFNFLLFAYQLDDSNLTPGSSLFEAYVDFLVSDDTYMSGDNSPLVDAGGRDDKLNQSNSEANDVFDEYKAITNTQDQYDKINQIDFSFDTADRNPFLEFAAATTFFTVLVESLWIHMGNFSSVLGLFLILVLISLVTGLASHVGTAVSAGRHKEEREERWSSGRKGGD